MPHDLPQPDAGFLSAADGTQGLSAADLVLRQMAASGIDYFFGNAGTDFPPIIEAFARAAQEHIATPRPLVVPHENLAVTMALGVTMITGRPQAAMVHVNVGTANTVNAILDASRDHMPLLLFAGRNPYSEGGRHGARSRSIHWAQEMFDQAGMLREAVKWDYELHLPEQAADVVLRGVQVATASPCGPVYITLPRDILAGSAGAARPAMKVLATPTAPFPDPAAIAILAGWLAEAERPVLITGAAGRTAAGFAALERLARECAIPVVSYSPRFVNLPASHPMHQGYQTHALVGQADLIITVESDVPWLPALDPVAAGCRVAQIGVDPAWLRYPMRSFPADLSITAGTAIALHALADSHARLHETAGTSLPVAARTAHYAARHQAMRAAWRDAGAAPSPAGITPEFLSRCVHDAIDDDTIVVNEYSLRSEQCPREKPGTYFGLSPAGGLGWGFGAALGAKLAAPEKTVIATLGDGAYMFNNPTACHWAAAAHGLPVLVIIFNNRLYGAVRNATMAMYGNGFAAQDNGRMLADLAPATAFEKLAEANGGYGECVEQPDDLPAALARALHAVRVEGRQALLNVICAV